MMRGQSVTLLRKPTSSPALAVEPPALVAAPEQHSVDAARETLSSLFSHDFHKTSVLRPQAKLTVSQPGDPMEQEAEQVADDVMRAEAPVSEEGNAEKRETTASSASLDRTIMRAPGDAPPPIAPPPPGDPSALPTDPNAQAIPLGPTGGGATNISVNPTTRSLSANNLSQLWDVMTNNGTRESASVLPKLTPEPQYEYDANLRVTKATITVVENKEMPSWSELGAQCAPIQAEWTRFYGVLDTHENNHIKIDQSHFTNLHARLIGKEQSVAWKMVDDEITAADTENQTYDTTSDHGVKEGANVKSFVQCAPEKVKSTSAGDTNDDNAAPFSEPSPTGAPPPTMQAKLAVSAPGDPAEQEADRMADRVMRAEAPEPARAPSPYGRAIQRECANPETCNCPRCRAQREATLDRAESGEGQITSDASERVSEVIGRGGGQNLSDTTRSFMEPRFGHDFSNIKIHSDDRAARSAASVQALAYTVGNDVVFGAGQYAPGTASGDRLLAHELTHTIQQGAAQRQIQREDDPNPNSDANQRKLIDAALKSNEGGKVKDINPFRFALANDSEKIQLIGILLDHPSWGFFGPGDADFVTHIWGSFGKNLVPAATSNIALWDRCVEKGAPLYSLPDLLPVKDKFMQAITEKAKGYLSDNKKTIQTEMQRLGLDNLNTPATKDQAAAIDDMRNVAKDVKRAQEARDAFLGMRVLVSYTPGAPPRHDQNFNPDTSAFVPISEGSEPGPPGEPPAYSGAPLPTWEETKKQYDKAAAVYTGLVNKYPTIYAMARDGKIDQLAAGKAGDDPAAARKAMADSMRGTLDNIAKTETLIADPASAFPLELKPIHDQLLGGEPWSKPPAKNIAKQAITDHGNDHFWETMALPAMGAALFVVAEIATGGLATFFLIAGAATSAATAYNSWDKALDLQNAAGSNLSDETALVSQEQANDAVGTAMLDTVFAFLDVWIAAKGVKGVLAAGEDASKLEGGAKFKDAQEKLAEAEGKETKAVSELKEVKGSAPVGAGHDVHMTGRGPERCSPAPCPVFTEFWENELERHPDQAERVHTAIGAEGVDAQKTAEALSSVDKALQDMEVMDFEQWVAGLESDTPKFTRMKQLPAKRADIANKALTPAEAAFVEENIAAMKADGRLPQNYVHKPPSAEGFVIPAELADKAMKMLGTKLSENAAVAECWKKAVDGALAGKVLGPDNFAELYKSAAGRFWPIVEENSAAKAFFAEHGFVVEGGISAALDVEGVARREVSIGLDHMLPKASGENWRYALDADQIQMIVQADNTKLSHLEKKDASLRR